MQKHCIYKLKEDNQLDKIDSIFVEYVIVDEFAIKSIGEDRDVYCIYKGINIDTFEYTSQILGYDMLTPKQFEENFELFMNHDEIRLKFRELEELEENKRDTY